MTTPLNDVVTRRTTLTVDGREVEVTLIPANATTATPESLSFHLVGLHEKSDKWIPLPMLLRLAGYDVKLPKGAKAEQRLSPTEEVRQFLASPEWQDLERRFLPSKEAA
jgi:hypothetical protein